MLHFLFSRTLKVMEKGVWSLLKDWEYPPKRITNCYYSALESVLPLLSFVKIVSKLHLPGRSHLNFYFKAVRSLIPGFSVVSLSNCIWSYLLISELVLWLDISRLSLNVQYVSLNRPVSLPRIRRAGQTQIGYSLGRRRCRLCQTLLG